MAFDYDAALHRLHKREKERRNFYRSLYDEALSDCEKILALIESKYAPLRIYQWGSLLKRDQFRDYSDIDIAVEGLKSPADFFALLADAEKLTNFPLDILQWEKIEPEFREHILLRGRMVYDRDAADRDRDS